MERELLTTANARPLLELEPVPALALLFAQLHVRLRSRGLLRLSAAQKRRSQQSTRDRARRLSHGHLENHQGRIDERIRVERRRGCNHERQ